VAYACSHGRVEARAIVARNTGPYFAREPNRGSLCAELERRAVKSHELIRNAFLTQIMKSIILTRAVVGLRCPSESSELEHLPGWEGIQPWLDILEPPDRDSLTGGYRLTSEYIGRLRGRLEAWAHAVPLENLIAWIPPANRDVLNQYPPFSGNADPEWRWIADRFTETYLSSWQSSSLREEWLYINGRRLAPLAVKDMNTRRVPELDLARVLADAKVKADQVNRGPTPHYIALALKLLGDGHRATAAAMFEAATALTPDNGELINNWAFCLIPDDPEQALGLLDKAITFGMATARTTTANKLYCYLLLERYSTGLAYAEDVLTNWSSLVGKSGYMWRINEEPATVSRVNLMIYTLDVIEAIAKSTCDPLLETAWAKKVEPFRRDAAV
jgi:hypothetical protein